jgi:uncharacterized protein YbcV (DUF1398 family)
MMINYEAIQTMVKQKMPFPDCVKLLGSLGIERYYVDLIRMEKTYYAVNGDSYIQRFFVEGMPIPGEDFDESKVVESLRIHQRGETDYEEFLRKIVHYGSTNYIVYINGKKALYFGRKGEAYTEKFPF